MNANSEEGVDEKTLIFKHLPLEMTEDDCKDFFRSLGALSSYSFGHRGPYRNCACAEFVSSEHAWKIVKSIHQRKFMGRRLCVEFFQAQPVEIVRGKEDEREVAIDHRKSAKDVSDGSSCCSSMAARWDPSLPVSPALFYKYPAATTDILTNVVRCMISCPAFYTQVLHVMNRLHLPPPFGDPDLFPGSLVVVSESDLTRLREDIPLPPNEPVKNDSEVEEMDLSSSTESELGSDEEPEKKKSVAKTHVPPYPRRNHVKLKPSRKRIRGSETAKAQRSAKPHPPVDVSDMFDTATPYCKLRIQVPVELHTTGLAEDRSGNCAEGGFGLLEPTPVITQECWKLPSAGPLNISGNQDEFQLRKDTSPQDSDAETPPKSGISFGHNETDAEPDEAEDSKLELTSLSLSDLYAGRLSVEERQNYPVFARGYTPGQPTSRLYIKNLAPSTTEEDLYRVFGCFQHGAVKDMNARLKVIPETLDRFSVQLLTAGRMKGQAFVSFEDQVTAFQALDATNGFLLHDRPMVVQYARGARAKVDEKSLISLSEHT